MVKVTSSSGKKVDVEILGIAETIRSIQNKQNKIISESQIAVVQAANLIQQEVQESIIGNRVEHKSVDTGRLGNSIQTEMISEQEYIIKPNKTKYPNSSLTTLDIAKFMEYGTSKGIRPRYHFRNTRLRVKPKIAAQFLKRVNISLK